MVCTKADEKGILKDLVFITVEKLKANMGNKPIMIGKFTLLKNREPKKYFNRTWTGDERSLYKSGLDDDLKRSMVTYYLNRTPP